MRYKAESRNIDGIETIQLDDNETRSRISIIPQLGNNAYQYLVDGQNFIWCPYASPRDMIGHVSLFGVPLLSPWANRLESDTYHVDQAEYILNPKLGNIRRDHFGHAIHGLVLFAPWSVQKATADENGAHVTSTLNCATNPRWMAQFPFAHDLRMSHHLANGQLNITLEIANRSSEAMPISVGFHPYFTLPGTSRDDWHVDLPVEMHWELSSLLIPTGETKPVERRGPFTLKGQSLDDVYGGLKRMGDDNAVFSAEATTGTKIEVGYGPRYRIAVVYSPPTSNFICFEPMAAPTNAFNLAYAGRYNELDWLASGGTWRESFWIRPTLASKRG